MFSIDFEYPTANAPHKPPRFTGGTTSVYEITGQGITASSFDALSTLDKHAFGTYLAAADVQGIPSGNGSGSIGTKGVTITTAPEPATITMGLMGLLAALAFSGWLRRRAAA